MSLRETLVTGGEDRAVSPVLGFVLVIGIMVLGLTVWQTDVVPSENSEHEFQHYQSVTDDLTQLRNNLFFVASTGSSLGTDVKTGFEYPPRVVLVNPAPVQGHLSTNHTQSVAFKNVKAVESEPKSVRTVWSDSREYTDVTKSIQFRADYNYAEEGSLPPMVVTGQTVYRATDERALSVADQTLIDGNRIRFVFIDGNLSSDGQSATVVAEAQSTAIRTVSITGNDSGNPIEIRFDPPAKLNAQDWVDEFGSDIKDSNSHVTGAKASGGQVILELKAGKTYHVEMAKVKVGDEETDPAALDPAYVVDFTGDTQSRRKGEIGTVTAEVRDKFNNPVREANVTFEVIQGNANLLDENNNKVNGPRNVSTNAEGRASQKFNITTNGKDIEIDANLSSVSGPEGNTTFVTQLPANETESENPVELAGVKFKGGTKSGSDVELTFKNTVSEDRSIDNFRMIFYQEGKSDEAENGTISDSDSSTDFQTAGVEVSTSLEIPANTKVTFTITWDNYKVGSGDWFTFSATYNTGAQTTYFASAE